MLIYTGNISVCSRKQYIYCACVQDYLHGCVCSVTHDIVQLLLIFVTNKLMKVCSSLIFSCHVLTHCVCCHSLLFAHILIYLPLTWLIRVMVALFRNLLMFTNHVVPLMWSEKPENNRIDCKKKTSLIV